MSTGFHTFNLKNIKKIVVSIAIPLLVGVLSAFLSGNQSGSYTALVLPPLSPPSWVFAVVWPILYVLMGISAYLVSSTQAEAGLKKRAFVLYAFQLVFNFFWSIWFFRFELLSFSFLWILLLFALVILTALAFYDINRLAGWLFLPYIAWLAFASYLNYMVWMLN
ncbi:MAG: tryptophan-rich sensory protein [Ruminococcaceae bacterium]|nr:tryptophan-rich sensory protein [Oscillospiraceae bacterium]